MRRRLVGALSTLALAACSGGGSDSPPVPTTGNLTLVNSSGTSIDELYVARSADTAWGVQRNASSIPSGTSFTQTGLDATQWDVMAVHVGAYSEYYAYGWQLPVTAGQTTTTTAWETSFSGTLDVVNDDDYGRTMSYLYVTPSGYAWGDDWLAGYALPYGYDYEIWGMPPGYYDVWCEFSDGYDDVQSFVTVTSLGYTPVSCGF